MSYESMSEAEKLKIWIAGVNGENKMTISDFDYEPGGKWDCGHLNFTATTPFGELEWEEVIPGPRHSGDSASVTVTLDGDDVSDLFCDLDFEAPREEGRWADEFREDDGVSDRLSAYLEVIADQLLAFKKEQEGETIEDYTKAIELNPTAKDYNERGALYYVIDKNHEAIADFTKAIELDPKYVFAYLNRGLVYQDLKMYEEAIADYTKAIELDPNETDACNHREEAYRLKKLDE